MFSDSLITHALWSVPATDLYKYSPDAVPPIHAVSYHVATDSPPSPPKMATSSGTTIYNQSQLAERKHVACYWSIHTAATAVTLSAHPSPLVITTKLAAAILGGGLFGGGVLPAQYCPCGTGPATYRYGVFQKRSGGVVSSRPGKCWYGILFHTAPLPAHTLQQKLYYH